MKKRITTAKIVRTNKGFKAGQTVFLVGLELGIDGVIVVGKRSKTGPLIRRMVKRLNIRDQVCKFVSDKFFDQIQAVKGEEQL